MYVHCESFSSPHSEIIIHFEITDYFEFCENHSYTSSFSESDEVNLEYKKYMGIVVHNIVSNYKCETLCVSVEDICGLSCSFKCNPEFHLHFSICNCELLQYFGCL